MAERLPSGIQFARFAVGTRPYCVWEWDLDQRNVAFLESLQPRYFSYLAEVHAANLEGEDRQLAALALRTAYSHALETFFALICAVVQAPHCIVGWMQLYRSPDLNEIVEAIHRNRGCLSSLTVPGPTWEGLAEAVSSFISLGDADKESWIRKGYAASWSRFAHDFLDSDASHEYNTIKHGLRLKPGGFRLAIGREETFGVAAPRERMHSLGGSEFGSSYHRIETVVPKSHLRVRRCDRNWDPRNFIAALQLLEMSTANLISFAKAINGVDPATLKFSWPSSPTDFDAPWSHHPGVLSFSIDCAVEPSDIAQLTPEEILKVYQPKES